MARSHGFSSRQEFLDYDCPGAYQLPKNPHEVWPTDWKDWDDWLGIPWQSYDVACKVAQEQLPSSVQTEKCYLALFENKDSAIDGGNDLSRLPYRPDLFYKGDWKGWEHFLGGRESSSE